MNSVLKTKSLSVRRVMLPLGVGTAVSLLGDSTLYTVLPDPSIAAQAGVTLTMVGVLLGVNRLVRLISNPLAGILYDRSRRKGVLVGSMGLGIISTCIFAFASGFGPLLVSRVLWGIAWSGIWIGGNTVVLDISEDADRGALSGRYQMWFYIGVGSSALLGGFFTDMLGFRQGLVLSASITLVAMLLWLLLLPETRPEVDGTDAPENGDIPFPWKVTITTSVPVFAIRFVFAGVIASTAILWLSTFFGDSILLGDVWIPIATLTGLFAALRTLTGIGGAPLGGALSDRIGERWPIVGAAFVLGAIGLWVMGLQLILAAILGAFLAALAGGVIQALAPAIAGDAIHAEQQGIVLGVIFSIGDIGSAAGPAIALWLIGWIGLGSVYKLCAIFMLLVGGFALLMMRFDRGRMSA